jgi:integrase
MARPQPRTRRLQPGEEERLMAAAGVHLRHLITAALDTGCRRGELLSLQWLHVAMNEDGEPKALVLPAHMTKTDRGRSVPISPRLRAILQLRRLDPEGKAHGPNAYVFGNQFGEKVSDVKLAWRGACKRAGIDGLTFHDLRREAASRLLQGGVDLLTVSMLLGHQKATTTDTYLRGRDDLIERQLQEYYERRADS